jgi:hypothetical protein
VESAAAALFPWRQLGALLQEEGLVSDAELELALDEQRRTGRLLGQIIVDRGYMSAFSLARVLSAQHGLHLHERVEPEQGPAQPSPDAPAGWRPLGRLLVEKGLITQTQLAEALLAQRDDQRLGELLVERSLISGGELARALSEQHGVELVGDVEATLEPTATGEPRYWVYAVAFHRGFQQRSVLSKAPSFLEAADFAMDLVQEQSPEALEIERVDGDDREIVWTYSESRAAAAQLARKDLVDTFGFDPTRWDPNR